MILKWICAVSHHFGCHPALLALGFSDAYAPITLFLPTFISLLPWLSLPIGQLVLILVAVQLSPNLVLAFISNFCFDWCQFLGFMAIH
jgi:hypothetical protein